MKNLNGIIRSIAIGLSSCATLFFLDGCGGGGVIGGGGELTGVPGRVYEAMTMPYGMIMCPSGTFHMGQADENAARTMVNQNKQITIGAYLMDETEITNNEYRQFIAVLLNDSLDILGEETIMNDYYPDTMVWVRDFSYHFGDPMMEYYFWHPAFDDYPVVGVDWFAAKYFSEWRTKHMNDWRTELGLFAMPRFRLPTEAEWEYGARGKKPMAKYPWGNPYPRNAKGCVLANFKPGRGNYFDDGFQYSSPVASYFPNSFGLYDMAGNVAEWCEDAWNDAAVPTVWDLNPVYKDDNEPKKIIRGGSWKDISYFCETGTKDFEYQDTTKSYVGFRCVMTYLGRSSGSGF
ncbi:MAG: SUMF1/EgtB/PvdO family nonheme iron enzyme [Cytophagales bacterium]|nr:SUMF1/EgtB/PvdO family nonheme iron enzyme [Cytophagales bacterium]